MVFFHEYPTLLPTLNHKVFIMKIVVLYIALYFISTAFMTLKLGRSFTPPPSPFISEEFVGYLNTVGF